MIELISERWWHVSLLNLLIAAIKSHGYYYVIMCYYNAIKL